MQTQYDYCSTLSASERIGWRIEDVLPEGRCLDFSKPLMPESLARVTSLSFLDEEEQLVVNHIRAQRISLHVRAGRGVHPALRARPCPASP